MMNKMRKDSMTLGERIQKYRKMKGLSQEEIGKLLHIQNKQYKNGKVICHHLIYKVVRLWLMFLVSL